jgi:hypothetical protein
MADLDTLIATIAQREEIEEAARRAKIRASEPEKKRRQEYLTSAFKAMGLDVTWTNGYVYALRGKGRIWSVCDQDSRFVGHSYKDTGNPAHEEWIDDHSSEMFRNTAYIEIASAIDFKRVCTDSGEPESILLGQRALA